MKKLKFLAIATLSFLFLYSCNRSKNGNTEEQNGSEKKIGVLFVSHGSHSKTWRNALLDLEKNTKQEILDSTKAQGIKSAFMEYNEPSIATRLKEFDKEGFTDVVIVPIFLTVSPHSFEDIPTIVGLKDSPASRETLKIENIERYTPKAKVKITPLLDFTNILQKNILRRVKTLSKDPKNEGVTLVGYGDVDYDKEWTELFKNIGKVVKDSLGITELNHAWCGHIAGYSSEPTTKAIEEILTKKKKDIVIPVLVAFDENFQLRIIGGGVEEVKDNKNKVIYKPDALLPDENIEKWVVDASKEYVGKVENNELEDKK